MSMQYIWQPRSRRPSALESFFPQSILPLYISHLFYRLRPAHCYVSNAGCCLIEVACLLHNQMQP